MQRAFLHVNDGQMKLLRSVLRSLLLVGVVGISIPITSAADGSKPAQVRIRLSVDEDPIVPHLAASLGFLRDERVEIVPVKAETFSKADYLIQDPLIAGQIDASYHWFHHAVFGARHAKPITAVMLFNDAPAMTVMVADRVRDRVRSAADFRGLRIAQGAGYGTKGLITAYLASKAGLPPHSYTPVLMESQGRQAAVLSALRAGTVDVMTFQEPVTSALQQTGLVSTLYDLNSAASTRRALGAALPAQSLLMSPGFIARHPQAVQRLVNALVRTMRYIETHSAAQIGAALPADYFAGKDRAAEIARLQKTLPSFSRADYRIKAEGARLVVDAIQSYDFDSSEEGRWRATAQVRQFEIGGLFDNRFVEKAMRDIR